VCGGEGRSKTGVSLAQGTSQSGGHKVFIKNKDFSWWLTPVTLATWEAEMERIVVQGQPRQIVCETPPSPK
jgi:hypothetical protein